MYIYTHEFLLQLSEGLKARLKRCGQYHSSPVDSGKTSKQPCLTLKKSEVKQLDRDRCGSCIVDMVTDTVTKDRSLKARVLKKQSAAEMFPSGDGILVTVKGELLETNDEGLENVCDNLQDNEYPGTSHYSGQDASYTPAVNRNIKNHDERHRTPCAPKDNSREHHSTPCVPRNTGRFGKLRCNKLSDSCITIPCIETQEQKSSVCSVEDLIKQKEQLQETLKSKEETLRKLKLVKMYRAKVSLDCCSIVLYNNHI